MPEDLHLATFGQRLRHMRRTRRMTLAELGERVGRAPSQLSLLENGRREPKLSLITSLAAALDVPVDELLSTTPPSRRAQLEIAAGRRPARPALPGARPAAAEGRPPDAERGARAHRRPVRRAASGATPSRPRRRRRPGSPTRSFATGCGGGATTSPRSRRSRSVRWAPSATAAAPCPTRSSPRSSCTAASRCGTSEDLPRSVRSITDLRNRRIYLRRESLGMHTPRGVLLQTLGHFVLDHEQPRDFADFLRQRVEANYFAAAMLVPETGRGAVPRPGQEGSRPRGRGPPRRVLRVVRDGRAPVHQPRDAAPRPALPLRPQRRGGHHLQGVRERRAGVPGRLDGRDRGAADVPALGGPAGLHLARPVSDLPPVHRHPRRHALVRLPRRLRARAATSR